jgi:hypothetical protein
MLRKKIRSAFCDIPNLMEPRQSYKTKPNDDKDTNFNSNNKLIKEYDKNCDGLATFGVSIIVYGNIRCDIHLPV